MPQQNKPLVIEQALVVAIKHHHAGQLSEAGDIYRQILDEDPEQPSALHLLGVIAHQRGENDIAINLITKALTIKPDFPAAYNNLGLAFHAFGKPHQALASYTKALELNPDYAEAHSNLCDILRATGQRDEAVFHARKALEIQPDLAEAHNSLGVALRDMQKVEEARTSFQKALSLKPDYREALKNLSIALRQLGELEDALAVCQQVLKLEPDDPQTHSNLLVMEQYRTGHTAETLYKLHCEWDHQHGRKFRTRWPQHKNSPIPDRLLRVGFVSPDLRHHPVGNFVTGMFEHLKRNSIEIFVYSSCLSDDLTSRIKTACDNWKDVRWTSDADLAQEILNDEIDILVDLSGHYTSNRLLVFARKPAPVQVTWAGYVGTTGLSAIDYLVTDRYSTPPNEDIFHSEKIVHMPDGWLSYTPPDYAPDVGSLPLEQNGHITFGSFSTRLKINYEVINTWIKILRSVPQSRLLLKYSTMDSMTSREFFTTELAKKGIHRSRVKLEGWSPHSQLLARYNDVDIALDPFPYSGGITTYEALWMGVPVITVPGATFASRHSSSHLSTIGLTELIACDIDDYVHKTVDLASDTNRLVNLRRILRNQVAGSPICDKRAFSENFARILRTIWRKWCVTCATPYNSR